MSDRNDNFQKYIEERSSVPEKDPDSGPADGLLGLFFTFSFLGIIFPPFFALAGIMAVILFFYGIGWVIMQIFSKLS